MYINYTQPRLKDQYPTEVFQRKEHQITFKLSEYLFKKFRWQKKIRLPLSYLAKLFGCSIKTIQRAVQYLESQDVLRVLRDPKQINIYYLSPMYRAYDVFNSCMIYFKNVVIFSLSLLASTPDVLLNINNGSYFIDYLRISESYSTRVCAREDNPETLSSQKKENVMSSNLEWSRVVTELHKQMPLRDHGFAKLSAFPPEAIKYAMQRMPLAYKAQIPFQYFIKVCEVYCTQNNIKPDWAQYKKMQDTMKVSNNAEYVDADALQKIIAEEVESPSNQYQQREVRQSKGKALDSVALKSRKEATDNIIRERQDRYSAPQANREEVIAGIMAQDWTDIKKKRVLEFLNLAWPLGQEPDIAAVYLNK